MKRVFLMQNTMHLLRKRGLGKEKKKNRGNWMSSRKQQLRTQAKSLKKSKS
jgi:hypothetical protein